MKTCLYSFTRGLYETECGGKSVARPVQKCDRCGRKPEEVERVTDAIRASNGAGQGVLTRKG